MKRVIALAIVLTLLLTLTAGAFAAKNYTYTLTFSTGRQGTFQSGAVRVSGKGDYKITESDNKITVTGLQLNDVVTFRKENVTVTADDRYYVRGIRESGKDNNTIGMEAIIVRGDQDYVVGYGIKGNMTQYTVKFEDADGKQLAEPHTYYGNVGDMPVVAYLYIDGYTPQAYNLSKVLSEKAENNVLTFVYNRIPANAPTPTTRPQQPTTRPSQATNPGDEPTEPTEPVETTEGGETEPTTEPENPENPDETEPTVPAVTDPTEPSELVIITDPEIPLDPGQNPGGNGSGSTSWVLWTAGGVGLLVILLAMIYFILRKKRKKA